MKTKEQILQIIEVACKLCIECGSQLDPKLILDNINLLKQNSSPVEPGVSQATCGFCKDCKFWDTENVECTKDIIWVVNKECYLKINDLKTQNYFGCTQFESKLLK